MDMWGEEGLSNKEEKGTAVKHNYYIYCMFIEMCTVHLKKTTDYVLSVQYLFSTREQIYKTFAF